MHKSGLIFFLLLLSCPLFGQDEMERNAPNVYGPVRDGERVWQIAAQFPGGNISRHQMQAKTLAEKPPETPAKPETHVSSTPLSQKEAGESGLKTSPPSLLSSKEGRAAEPDPAPLPDAGKLEVFASALHSLTSAFFDPSNRLVSLAGIAALVLYALLVSLLLIRCAASSETDAGKSVHPAPAAPPRHAAQPQSASQNLYDFCGNDRGRPDNLHPI
ncbi:MAG: hypothetical protein GY862_26725 [Gammaproteobacteria bacterium]|nr:hypothetical protein [Gammaproteobacteria bacterium]